MGNKEIIIVTEGNLKMGLGHVYRSLALAKELSKFGKVSFLTTSGDIVLNKVSSSGFEIYRLIDNEALKNRLEMYNPDTVVIDKLDVDELFAKYIKTHLRSKLIIFGNVSSANRYADVVINAIIGTDFRNRSFIDKNTGTLYLEGPKYLVLRREFYRYKGLYKFRNSLEKVLLIFGGSDPANLTCKVLEKILDISDITDIKVVLGPAFKFDTELNLLLKRNANYMKQRIDIYKNINNVADLMLSVDLVFTSAGTTMFESFLIGLPTITFYQNELQKNMFKGFVTTYDFNNVTDFKSFLFSNYRNYYLIKKKIDKLEVGEGRQEIIKNTIGGV